MTGSLILLKYPGNLNWQHTNLNVTPYPTESFGILSTTCDKVTEEW